MKLPNLIPAVAIVLTGTLAGLSAQAQGAPDGSYCREFTQPIKVNGHTVTGYGTSCQQPDGQWQIVQQPSVNNAPPPADYTAAPPPPSYGAYPPYPPYYAPGYVAYPYAPAPYYDPVLPITSFSFGYSNGGCCYHGGWHGGGGHWH